MKTDSQTGEKGRPAANVGKARLPQADARPVSTFSKPSEDDMADLERSMSALKFVPPSVTSKSTRGKFGQSS